MPQDRYIGLMSGTSLDGIDIAIVDLTDDHCSLIAAGSADISDALRDELMALCAADMLDPERIARADVRFGIELADATNQFLRESGIPPESIAAIGSHGQTIRHRPKRNHNDIPGFTWQIGDPNIIAERTGITTVGDFRRRDIAAGGQGAPLVPAFHQAMFSQAGKVRAVLNIGGMANITVLGSEPDCIGFDTGPGNVLLDAWHMRHRQSAFDQNGDWARSGNVDSNLLLKLLEHPFLSLAPPKSTGREEFNISWLSDLIEHHCPQTQAADIQSTLLDFTAISAAKAVNAFQVEEVFVCGGGAHNGLLMQRLAELIPNTTVNTTAVLGIDPDWVEAIAFAWLAKRTLNKLSGNVPAVTGASHRVPLGSIHLGSCSD